MKVGQYVWKDIFELAGACLFEDGALQGELDFSRGGLLTYTVPNGNDIMFSS
jgi:hypothetical protein